MILKNGKRIDGSSLTSVTVVDDLLGGISTEALSANQGRILNEKIIAQQEELNNKIADVETVIEYISKDEGGLSDLPFIITDHKPGVYTFGGQYNNTCSSVYVKWTENNDTQWLSYSGIYFFTDTTDEGISKDIGFIIDWGDGAIRNLRVDSTGKVSSSNSWPIVMVTNKNQTISSVKTFTELPVTSIEPTNDTHMVNKKYVDDIVAAIEIPTVPTNISAFTNDRGYITGYTETDPTVPSHVKAITTANIEDWNNKSEFSGSYNDLTNKPTIPSKTSELTNDSGFLTEVPGGYVTETDLAKVAKTGNYHDLDNTPTQLSDFVDDIGLVTAADLAKVATTGSYNDLLNLPDLTSITAGMKADQLWSNTDNPAYVAPVEETGEFQGYNVYQLETGMYIIPDNTMLYYGNHSKGDGPYTQLYEGIAEGLLIVANDPANDANDSDNCHVVSSVLIDTTGFTYCYSFYDTATDIYANVVTYDLTKKNIYEFSYCNINHSDEYAASAFTTYQFEEGMTWADWVASEYNTTVEDDITPYFYINEGDTAVYAASSDGRSLCQGNGTFAHRPVLATEPIGPGCWYYSYTQYP